MQSNPDKQIVELDNGVYACLYSGLTNAGFIIGDDGVLVIDSLRVPSFARGLISDIKTVTSKPVRYVVDTHSHWDHSWGNEEFPDSTIIGHQNCYNEMVDVEWNDAWRKKVINANDPWSKEAGLVNITPPNLTFDTSMKLYLAGREIQLLYFGRAHTSGDTFIYLPAERIVFTGDVAQDAGMPFLGDSYPEEWPETDDKLVDLAVDRFVSGHGPIGNHKAMSESRDFMHKFVNTIKMAKEEGQDENAASNYTAATIVDQFAHWRGIERLKEAAAEVYRKLG